MIEQTRRRMQQMASRRKRSSQTTKWLARKTESDLTYLGKNRFGDIPQQTTPKTIDFRLNGTSIAATKTNSSGSWLQEVGCEYARIPE